MGFWCAAGRRVSTSRTTRRVAAALLGALLVAMVGACDNQHTHAQQPEQGTLRVGYQPLVDDAPLFIAQQRHLFDHAGIKLRLVPEPDDHAALSALKSGAVDVAFGSDVGLLKAAANGADIRLQAEAYLAGPNTMAIVAPPQLQYDLNPKQIEQHPIAVNELGGLAQMVLEPTLGFLGVDPHKQPMRAMPFKNMIQALRNHQVVSAWLEEPYLTEAQKQLGYFALGTARGGQTDMPMSSYATTTRFAEQNPITVRVFRQVMSQAQQLASDVHLVHQALPRYCDVDRSTAALVSVGTFPQSLSVVRLQRVADDMQQAKLLNTRLDVKPLVPPELRQ